uniref:Embryonic stem cell-specific 5-hydroxymethylcytosine-binding protein n=1 Tax=Kalanchoe fedtschenkoi TaxID=63787 RepID=A0A7N0UFI1_KALFE
MCGRTSCTLRADDIPRACHLANHHPTLQLDRFYEWWKGSSRKQPYYIHFKDDRPLVLAALFDTWRNAEGEIFQTFTIVTTSSSPALQWLHDRMPVILGNKASTHAWLNESSNCNLDMLLKPYEERDLVWYPVTPAMGKPSFDGPECIKEVPLKAETKQISSFFTKKPAKSQIENIKDGKSSSDCANIDTISSVKEESTIGSRSPDDSASLSWPNMKKETEETDNKVKCELYATGGDDSAIVPPVVQQEECISSVKRGRTDVSATSKMTLEKFDEIYAIPGKKRGKVMKSSNKQPTLMCYFRKSQD